MHAGRKAGARQQRRRRSNGRRRSRRKGIMAQSSRFSREKRRELLARARARDRMNWQKRGAQYNEARESDSWLRKLSSPALTSLTMLMIRDCAQARAREGSEDREIEQDKESAGAQRRRRRIESRSFARANNSSAGALGRSREICQWHGDSPSLSLSLCSAGERDNRWPDFAKFDSLY